jgi:Zn-finger nucleic acid-binding protein
MAGRRAGSASCPIRTAEKYGWTQGRISLLSNPYCGEVWLDARPNQLPVQSVPAEKYGWTQGPISLVSNPYCREVWLDARPDRSILSNPYCREVWLKAKPDQFPVQSVLRKCMAGREANDSNCLIKHGNRFVSLFWVEKSRCTEELRLKHSVNFLIKLMFYC